MIETQSSLHVSDLSNAEAASLELRLKSLEAAFLRPYRGQIFVALACMFLQSLLVLPLPWLQGQVID
jgi:ABC-type multidrug transport system fused ATPase/permease subunit